MVSWGVFKCRKYKEFAQNLVAHRSGVLKLYFPSSLGTFPYLLMTGNAIAIDAMQEMRSCCRHGADAHIKLTLLFENEFQVDVHVTHKTHDYAQSPGNQWNHIEILAHDGAGQNFIGMRFIHPCKTKEFCDQPMKIMGFDIRPMKIHRNP